MARNRKNQPVTVRFGPALKAISLCIFIASSGLGYVWQKNQIYALSEQIKESETRLEDLRRHNEALGRTLAALQLPSELEARARQMNLSLMSAQPEQVVRLAERPLNSGNPGAQSLYATGTSLGNQP
jgi:hypothetical protein